MREKIRSVSNEQVKRVVRLREQAKERKKTGLYLVEGIRMAAEIPESDLEELLVTEEFVESMSVPSSRTGKKEQKVWNLIQRAEAENRTILVSGEVMEKMAGTCHPQGILAVLRQPRYRLADFLSDIPFLLVLDHLQDPGNVGTIFRTAEAAGADGICLSEDSASVFSPKTVRSTMGSVFRLPFWQAGSREEFLQALAELKKRKTALIAMSLTGETYSGSDFRKPVAFLIGNEGNGLSRDVEEMADSCIRIPMKGQTESLNAAVSAAIVLYETARQRGF